MSPGFSSVIYFTSVSDRVHLPRDIMVGCLFSWNVSERASLPGSYRRDYIKYIKVTRHRRFKVCTKKKKCPSDNKNHKDEDE